MVHAGYGRHIYYLTKEQLMQASKISYIINPIAFLGTVFGRVSFAVSLIMLMGIEKWRRWLLYFIIVTQFASTLVVIGLLMFGCHLISKYWNRSIPGSCIGGLWRRAPGYVQGGKDPTIIGLHLTILVDGNIRLQHLRGLGTGLDAFSSYSKNEFGEENKGRHHNPNVLGRRVSVLI
jgi:hypothetical protein